MPTATPSVYRRFHKYNRPQPSYPARLAKDEVFLGSIKVEIPDTYTILTGTVKEHLMGQSVEVSVQKDFTGDNFIEALKRAKLAGATNISVLLGAGSYVS